MEDKLEDQSFFRSFPKANQSHPVQIPTTTTSCLLFASLPVVQKLFSWYQQVRRQESEWKKDRHKVNCILNSLHMLEH